MISKERICFYPITSNDGAQKAKKSTCRRAEQKKVKKAARLLLTT
jgi:hypothetical protein